MAINAKAKVKLRWLTGIQMETVKVDGPVKSVGAIRKTE